MLIPTFPTHLWMYETYCRMLFGAVKDVNSMGGCKFATGDIAPATHSCRTLSGMQEYHVDSLSLSVSVSLSLSLSLSRRQGYCFFQHDQAEVRGPWASC